jgi:hypothetical protein
MTLENLVPPLELCKKIPAGAFADSALVWMETRTGSCVVQARITSEEIPAPTLAEIIVALDKAGYWCPTCFYRRGIWHIDCEDRTIMDAEDKDNPASAALNLWLMLEGGK